MAKAETVPDFLQRLVHARKDEIEALRRLVLDAVPGLGEQIKWNAPSFGLAGDDRVTMRLQPGDRVQLVLHRGVKPRPDDGFSFADRWGLVEWATADRGTLTIADRAHLEARSGDIGDLVAAWIRATT